MWPEANLHGAIYASVGPFENISISWAVGDHEFLSRRVLSRQSFNPSGERDQL